MSDQAVSRRLDGEISDGDIEKIAREYLTDWKGLRPHLGLSRPQEVEINESSTDYGEQKRAFLYMWKEQEGSGATYRALITAAEKIKNKQLAENVEAMVVSNPTGGVIKRNPLSDTQREKFYKELAELERGDSLRGQAEAKKIRKKAEQITCFYCLDYGRVYRDRGNVFDFLDGRGSYDMINCIACKGNDHWLKCSRDPDKEYPGIVNRASGKKAESLLDKLR